MDLNEYGNMFYAAPFKLKKSNQDFFPGGI